MEVRPIGFGAGKRSIPYSLWSPFSPRFCKAVLSLVERVCFLENAHSFGRKLYRFLPWIAIALRLEGGNFPHKGKLKPLCKSGVASVAHLINAGSPSIILAMAKDFSHPL